MYDSHVHSENSKDGRDSVQKIADYLPNVGIVSCAITDHCELVKETQFDDIKKRMEKIEAEIEEVNEAKKNNIMFGIELGSAQINTELAGKIINSFNFDVVLGSVHSVPDFVDVYKLREGGADAELIRRALKSYFNEIKKLVVWNKFDVLTHLWYPVRYISLQKQIF
ncbi:MAG: PHP domain-containing protein, partial [Oscillospiraceae bacterium]